MRTEFVQCDTTHEAYAACPWAFLCVQVDGGYRCWESPDDFAVWLSQN